MRWLEKKFHIKILIVTQYFWPETFLINDLACGLVSRNHQVEVLTGAPNYPMGNTFSGYSPWGFGTEVWGKILIHRVPLVPRGLQKPWQLSLNYLSFVFFGATFGTLILRKKKFDAIFVYAVSPILSALPALLLGCLKKSPVCVWVQDLWPESLQATGYLRNKLLLRVIGALVVFIYRTADLLLAPSEGFFSKIKWLAGRTPVRIHSNPGPKAPKERRASILLKRPANHRFSILFAGNIGSAQAVQVIVQAAELLQKDRDIIFVVVGDGTLWHWMKNEIKHRGLQNIQLRGRHPACQIPKFMRRADALLVTLADQPIFSLTVPSKIPTYFSAGLPIIACLNGEAARLVTKSRAGIAVPAENAHELAKAVKKLRKMPRKARIKMGKAGREYFEQNFEPEVLLLRLEKLFQEMIAKHSLTKTCSTPEINS